MIRRDRSQNHGGDVKQLFKHTKISLFKYRFCLQWLSLIVISVIYRGCLQLFVRPESFSASCTAEFRAARNLFFSNDLQNVNNVWICPTTPKLQYLLPQTGATLDVGATLDRFCSNVLRCTKTFFVAIIWSQNLSKVAPVYGNRHRPITPMLGRPRKTPSLSGTKFAKC